MLSFRQYLEEGLLGNLGSALLKTVIKPAAQVAEKQLTKITEPVSRQAFKQTVPANPDVIYNTLTRAGKDVEKTRVGYVHSRPITRHSKTDGK